MTAFRMFLMVRCIGIYVFTNQRRTPAIIRTRTIVNSGMIIVV
jgi:hypothetical protein